MTDNPYLGKAEELLALADAHRAQVEATLAVADELRRLREASYR